MATKKDPVALPSVPNVPATQKDIERWYVVAEQMTKLKEEEMTLRKKIFGTYFQTPEEGVNILPMTDGFVMKGTYKIDRKIVEEAYKTLLLDFQKAGLPLEDLVKMEPKLSVSAYKKLDAKQQKLFDKALEIKPGAPTLEIVKPKRV